MIYEHFKSPVKAIADIRVATGAWPEDTPAKIYRFAATGEMYALGQDGVVYQAMPGIWPCQFYQGLPQGLQEAIVAFKLVLVKQVREHQNYIKHLETLEKASEILRDNARVFKKLGINLTAAQKKVLRQVTRRTSKGLMTQSAKNHAAGAAAYEEYMDLRSKREVNITRMINLMDEALECSNPAHRKKKEMQFKSVRERVVGQSDRMKDLVTQHPSILSELDVNGRP